MALSIFDDPWLNEGPRVALEVDQYERVITDHNGNEMPIPLNLTGVRSISYEKIESIGKGGNGEVFNGLLRCRSENDEPPMTMPVAVKTINARNSQSTEKIIEETKQMAEFKNPHVIRTYSYHKNDETVDVIMELCWGSLKKFMREKTFELTEEQKVDILLQIAYGANYFHSINVVHRDLKPDNVVLSEQPTNVHALALVKYKIIDPSSSQGTVVYMSPEAIDNKYSKESDVYAFGILAWELLTEQEPFEELGFTNNLQLAYDIAIYRSLPPIPDYIDEDLAALLRDTWSQNPSDRPTFAQIIPRLQTIKQKLHAQTIEQNAYQESILTKFEDYEPTEQNESNQSDYAPNVPVGLF